jgi:hypothetical protein
VEQAIVPRASASNAVSEPPKAALNDFQVLSCPIEGGDGVVAERISEP